METQSEQIPGDAAVTDEFKLVSLFSHLSILFGSLIVPLIIWILYREKSKFASFHAMQSLFFHFVYIVIMVFVVLIVSGVIMLSGLGGSRSGNPNALQIVLILLLSLFVIGYVFGSIGYAVYLGIKAYKGELKKYPIIGNIVYNKMFAKSA